MVTGRPQWGRKPERKRKDRQGASPGWRARTIISVSLKIVSINVYNDFFKKAMGVRCEVVGQDHGAEFYLCITIYGKTEKAGRRLAEEGTSSRIKPAHDGLVNWKEEVFSF